MRLKTKLTYVFAVGVFLSLISLYLIGGVLVSPKPTSVGLPPSNIPIEIVQIDKIDGRKTHGWFLAGEPNKAGVLLLHGVRSDRREMLARARFLFAAGYSVLLIDMQAHGESPGDYVTFGYLESIDAHAALAYLSSRVGGRPVGVIGSSMGGAAAVLGDKPLNANAIVMEGVYSTLEQAIKNRIAIRLGNFGSYLSPLLSTQLNPRLGISPRDVVPADAVGKLKSPVLIISGTEDRYALPTEARKIFDNANQPKFIWFIEDAKHQDLHLHSETTYEHRILDFFSDYLVEAEGFSSGS